MPSPARRSWGTDVGRRLRRADRVPRLLCTIRAAGGQVFWRPPVCRAGRKTTAGNSRRFPAAGSESGDRGLTRSSWKIHRILTSNRRGSLGITRLGGAIRSTQLVRFAPPRPPKGCGSPEWPRGGWPVGTFRPRDAEEISRGAKPAPCPSRSFQRFQLCRGLSSRLASLDHGVPPREPVGSWSAGPSTAGAERVHRRALAGDCWLGFDLKAASKRPFNYSGSRGHAPVP